MCLGALLSCGATCCAGCCCSAFKDCKAKDGPGSRIPYMFIMFIFSVFAICMALFGEEIVWENDLLDYEFQICTKDSCKGNGAIYRTSFSLFIFFLIHVFVIYFVPSFHHLFFIIKLFCLVAVLTATFFIPGTFFEDGYVQFARIGSSVFLLIQIYVLIGWAWDCNERITQKIDDLQQDGSSPDADEDEVANKGEICLFQTLLVGGTAAIYAAVVTLWVFEFEWFVYEGGKGECRLNEAMLALMVVLVVLLTVLPPLLRNGSIFTTAIVSFYISYLTFAGLEASDDADCNWFASRNDQLSLWLGFLFTIAAISYTGFSVSKHFVEMSDGSMSTRADDKESAKDNSHDDDDEADDGAGTSNYDDAVSGGDDGEDQGMNPKDALLAAEKKANVTFHVCMTFASIYMCMLYTGWGDDQVSSDAKARGTTAMVVNILCVWVTAILYGWTLVAPKLCPSRFGGGDDDDDEEINMEI